MTQRTLAGILAVPLLIALWLAAALAPLPYVTYEPGLTVDVLGDNDQGQEIIDVSGRKAFRDDEGQLRMTTVYVSQPRPEGKNNLFELMHDWLSDEDAVYPYDAVGHRGLDAVLNLLPSDRPGSSPLREGRDRLPVIRTLANSPTFKPLAAFRTTIPSISGASAAERARKHLRPSGVRASLSTRTCIVRPT